MLDIIIVNWNSGTQLKNCLTSINRFSDPRLNKTIVIDNNSSDSSAQNIDATDKVKVIFSKVNLGFGKASNLGAQNSNEKYLLFLNPDAMLHDGTLKAALNYMESEQASEFDICGIKLIDEGAEVARSCSRFPTAAGFISHSIGLSKVLHNTNHLMTEWDHLETRRVDHVIGAFFLVRRNLFTSLKGFDERFFLYLEDLDFSLRASKIGSKTIYFAGASAFHAGGGTSRQIKAKRLFYSLCSRLTYADHHFSAPSALLVKISTLLVEPISRSALSVSTGSWAGLKETWIAYMMLWRWLFIRQR